MKKIYLITLLTFFSYLHLNAQNTGDIEVGFQTGLNLANVSTSDGEGTSSRVSYNFGASGEYYFSDTWGIKTKLIYDNKGWKDGFIFLEDDFNDFTTDFELTYLTIPVMANWHFGSRKNWYLNVGPYIGFLLNAEDSEFGLDISEAFNNTDVGLAVGIGYKFMVSDKIKLFAEFDGQSGFIGVFDEVEGENVRNGRASFNVGILFDL